MELTEAHFDEFLRESLRWAAKSPIKVYASDRWIELAKDIAADPTHTMQETFQNIIGAYMLTDNIEIP